ncbi:vesicle transport protein GOT1 isoform X1 [Nicotiana tabacum]|uniref:Vesicle transport protein GOT1 isoform X1 n=1 Tax=Nicotiana tabacum TaxID=4097 RepID=A0AC58TJA0_TOBAC|nr:vesicle transport protein GOT1-like isoform X2 [Nicotiana tomentosiformis]
MCHLDLALSELVKNVVLRNERSKEDWARIDGIWSVFLIPWDCFLFRQGTNCHGKWVALTIGLKSSLQFFMKRSNYKGTISFGAGFFFVVIGWPILGMILEAYGFVVLFSGFWPTLAVFLQKIPIIGWIFQQPFVRSFFDRYRGKRVPV